ncbi:hypothetical protein BWI17_00590 [Betaproteobacteria bacterium GR16-43]|nr:hypothetical protein BWI17_00590 [Betaproteobacteria bacterium GR16-43]
MPRLTPMLRLAFALASLMPLFPLIIVLGVYELFPLTVVGISRSWGTITAGIAAALAFLACWALVITGWNPLHRVDVELADLRAQAIAERPPAIPTSLPQRILGVIVVVGVAALASWIFREALRAVASFFQ